LIQLAWFVFSCCLFFEGGVDRGAKLFTRKMEKRKKRKEILVFWLYTGSTHSSLIFVLLFYHTPLFSACPLTDPQSVQSLNPDQEQQAA